MKDKSAIETLCSETWLWTTDVEIRERFEISDNMTNGPSGNIPATRHEFRSLADDVTSMVATPSVGSKQPTEFQVIAESCEWCMVDTPWTGDDDDDLVEASANSKADPTQYAGTPKVSVNPPAFGKMYGVGQAGMNGENNLSSRKTLGPRMI